MAKQSLGWPGLCFGWGIYIMLYALNTAYLTSLTQMAETILSAWHWHLTHTGITLGIILFFSTILTLGTSMVDHLNRIFMGIMGLAFVALILALVSAIQVPQLARTQWPAWPSTFAITITAYGFHIIIPSLRQYLSDSSPTATQRLPWAAPCHSYAI